MHKTKTIKQRTIHSNSRHGNFSSYWLIETEVLSLAYQWLNTLQVGNGTLLDRWHWVFPSNNSSVCPYSSSLGTINSCRTVHQVSQCALCCTALPANCSSVRMNSAMSVNKDSSLKRTVSIKSTSGAESIKMCGHHPWSWVLMQPFFYSQNTTHWAMSVQWHWGI